MPQALRYYAVSFLVPNAQVRAGIQAILTACPEHVHVLGNTYVIGTTEKANDLIDRLVPFLGGPDRVFVVEIAKRPKFSGWLPKDGWVWLHEHLLPATDRDLPFPARKPPQEIEHQEIEVEDADEESA